MAPLQIKNKWSTVPVVGMTASLVDERGLAPSKLYMWCKDAGMQYVGVKPLSATNIQFYLEAFVYSRSTEDQGREVGASTMKWGTQAKLEPVPVPSTFLAIAMASLVPMLTSAAAEVLWKK